MTYRGDNPCDVLLIGEAPGRSEDILGDPFVGEAGHYLKSIVDVAFKQHVRVVHCKKEPFDVMIDRSTKWGNPYSHKDGTAAKWKSPNIEAAIDGFERVYENTSGLKDSLGELADKTLGCWCKPGPCHGDVLVGKVQEKFPTLRVGYSNICCCLPLGEPEVTGGQRPIRPPEKPEAEACRPRLLELINIVRPKAIVTLGKVPTRFLPKVKDGLPACVQFVEETIHPAALLRMQNDNPIRYKESRNRCLLTLTRVKYRLWGID